MFVRLSAFRSCYPLNRFQSNLEGWFPMTLAPRSFNIQSSSFMPGHITVLSFSAHLLGSCLRLPIFFAYYFTFLNENIVFFPTDKRKSSKTVFTSVLQVTDIKIFLLCFCILCIYVKRYTPFMYFRLSVRMFVLPNRRTGFDWLRWWKGKEGVFGFWKNQDSVVEPYPKNLNLPLLFYGFSAHG